jgi:hypothetical protein
MFAATRRSVVWEHAISYQLVVVVPTMEKRMDHEEHACEHAAQAPQIQ